MDRIKKYWAVLTFAFSVVSVGVVHLTMGWDWVLSLGVNAAEQEHKDSVLTRMANDYERFHNSHEKQPLDLTMAYTIFYREIDRIDNRIDSNDFITGQNANLLFSSVFLKKGKLKDSSGTEYWFLIDRLGGLWWREKFEDRNGNIIHTFQYTVHYQSSTDTYQYTDWKGRVRRFKKHWEDD